MTTAPKTEKKTATPRPADGGQSGHRIEIEPVEGEFEKILKKPE